MSSQKKSNTSSKQSLKTDVKGQLSEFYKVAKEKLLAVKNDVQTAKKEYEAQKERNRKKDKSIMTFLTNQKN